MLDPRVDTILNLVQFRRNDAHRDYVKAATDRAAVEAAEREYKKFYENELDFRHNGQSIKRAKEAEQRAKEHYEHMEATLTYATEVFLDDSKTIR